MSKALMVWRCDVCKKDISDVKKGYVIWKSDKELKSYGFKIIHQTKCDLKDHSSSAALEDFIGEQGLAYLLSHLSLGPIKAAQSKKNKDYIRVASIDEYVDFIRRVQTPHYEEARQKFSNSELREDYSDSNEVAPYFPEELEKISKKY